MNAFTSCNKNHLPILVSPTLPKLCFSPSREDTPAQAADPAQTQLWAKHVPGAESSPMKGFGSSCSTKLSAAVSCSLLSLILPKISQAFCLLILLHTDVRSFIKQSLPGPPGSDMNNQILFKCRCLETWRRSEWKRGKLWFGAG